MRKKVNIKEQELNVNTATMINEEEKDSTVVAVQVSETEVEHEDVKEQIPIKLSDDIYIREGEAPWIGVQIYNYLSDKGEVTLNKMSKDLDLEQNMISMGLGWLSREDKLSYTRKPKSVTVKLV